MSVSWSDSLAVENFKLFKENANARLPWERDAGKLDNFRYAEHFSRSEEREMLAFNQAPTPISLVTAICDTAEAMMTSSKPTIAVAPLINPYNDAMTELSKSVAQKYQYVIQKDWYDSLGGLQYDRVARDSSNVGHGFFYVVPKYRNGEFYTDIKHIGWRYVYLNKYTKDPFYRDVDNCSIAMRISNKYGLYLVNQVDPDITEQQFKDEFYKGRIGITGPPTPIQRYETNDFRDGVLFNVSLKKERNRAWMLIPKNIQGERVTDSMVQFVTEVTEDLREQQRRGEIEIREADAKDFLTVTTAIGNKAYKKTYPVEDINLVPLTFDHRDNPYPLGRMWYLYPIQRVYNKLIMITILNGSLTSMLRIFAEEGAITDKHEFKKNFSLPGGLIEFKRPLPSYSKEPIIVEGKPLGDAWLQMPQYLSYVMEYISGIFGAMMGDSRDTPNVFSTVASLQSTGGLRIKRRLAHVDAALSVVGRLVGNFYKNYAPLNGYASQIDRETGEMKEPVKYNVVQPYKRMVNGKEVDDIRIDPTSDLSIGFKDIRFISQGSSGYEAGTEAALLTNLATQLKVPQLVPLILTRLNIKDVDKITKGLNLVNQQQQTIEQLGQTIKELEGRAKVLANQVTQKSFETSKAQFDAWFAQKKGEINQLTQGNGNGRE